MNIKRLRVQVHRYTVASALLCLCGFVLTMSASAQVNLPSSLAEPQGEWERMNPSSFKGTVSDLFRQCVAQAAKNKEDRLTSAKCDLLKELATAKLGESVLVKDGTSFTFLQGRVGGVSKTLPERVKKLGRYDKALLFDLGDDVYAYWFTGDRGRSCNNLATVLPPPLKVSTQSVRIVCQQTPIGGVVNDGNYHYHDDVLVRDCGQMHYIRSHSFHMEGTLQSNGYTEDCVPVVSQ